MNMNIFVRIIGVGTGNNAMIGMTGGNIQWMSNSGTFETGFYSGFIDNNTIEGVSSSCNIVNGGGLGGLDGEISINASSPELQALLIGGDIQIVGKYIEVWVSTGSFSSAVIRYSGKVGAWELQDEVTVLITSDPSVSLDSIKIPSVTIDEKMALGVVGSSAIGETVERSMVISATLK